MLDWGMIGGICAALTLALVAVQEIRWQRSRKPIEWTWYRGHPSDLLGAPVSIENNNGLPIKSVIVVTTNCELRDGGTRMMWPVLRDGDRRNLLLQNVTEHSWLTILWRDPWRARYESTWFPAQETGRVADAHRAQLERSFQSRRPDRSARGLAGPTGALRGRVSSSPRTLTRLTRGLSGQRDDADRSSRDE